MEGAERETSEHEERRREESGEEREEVPELLPVHCVGRKMRESLPSDRSQRVRGCGLCRRVEQRVWVGTGARGTASSCAAQMSGDQKAS